ncbi:MAG: hypothetical protein KME40_18320 [Komarekiella atlantica HA4396-MV6]|nr:hypothetical protein [Komarekiella atlantica HA4396-MV6]
MSVLKSSDACLEKLSHCVGRVSRLVASGVPTAGNPPTELFAAAGYANGGSRRSDFSLRRARPTRLL